MKKVTCVLFCVSFLFPSTSVADIFVSNPSVDTVVRIDDSGTFHPFIPSMSGPGPYLLAPAGITIGKDGNIYVTSTIGPMPNNGSILRYNGSTGDYIDVFATHAELDAPRALRFGPDDDLYLVEHDGHVLKFDGMTGAFEDNFPVCPGGGISSFIDIAWRQDSEMFVSDDEMDVVRRFNGTCFEDFTFGAIPPMDKPKGIRFGDDGDLYVSDPIDSGPGHGRVLRFDGTTGEFLPPAFIVGDPNDPNDIDSPQGIEFRDGSLFVASAKTDSIVQYDATTGGFINSFTSDLLDVPQFFAITPIPEPSAFILAVVGLLGLCFCGGRRRRQSR